MAKHYGFQKLSSQQKLGLKEEISIEKWDTQQNVEEGERREGKKVERKSKKKSPNADHRSLVSMLR